MGVSEDSAKELWGWIDATALPWLERYGDRTELLAALADRLGV